jgi:hypothetical protein
MKHYIFLISIFVSSCSSFMIGSSLNSNLPKGCDPLYAENVSSILTQLKGVATQGQLKEYKHYMLAIKLRNDMLAKITPFEQSLKSEDLALLRAPLTNYTACRSRVGTEIDFDYQSTNPLKKVFSVCETSYAAQMQKTLNMMRNNISYAMLSRFENFMILLKYYADLGFFVTEFERKTAYVVLAALQEPLGKYTTCRDSLLLFQRKDRPY